MAPPPKTSTATRLTPRSLSLCLAMPADPTAMADPVTVSHSHVSCARAAQSRDELSLLSSDILEAVKLHVGCAMWTYAPWQGRYLPGSLSPNERLRAYATWCNAVEGNTTFYAIPALDTVKSWAEQTTADFRFVLKLPKAITHERRLADVADP